MMGGAPTGFPEHPLTGVSAFKESLGWSKIELYGNFDLVLHTWLYSFFKRYTEFRGKH
jgi:lipid II:glycine glycyltransferase (peptidoglycan interpeptide bridge formation enzyme)